MTARCSHIVPAFVIAVSSAIVPVPAEVTPYPAYPGEPSSNKYSITADGQDVFIHNSPGSGFHGCDYARFVLTGSATISVTVNGGLSTYQICPLAWRIPSTRNGNTFTFTLNKPCNLYFRFGDGDPGLALFADPPEVNPPQLGDANVKSIMDYGIDATGATVETARINNALSQLSGLGGPQVLYFPRGIYQTGTIMMASNVTIYLAADALLKSATTISEFPDPPNNYSWGRSACMYFNQTNNAGLIGRGTFHAQGTVRKGTVNKDIHMVKPIGSRNTTIEGVLLLDSYTWTFHPIDCDTMTVRNVKIVASDQFVWNDGYDLDVCRDVLVENCFYFGVDDASCVKGLPGVPSVPAENIVFKDCVFWSKANGLRFGYTQGGNESQWSYANNIHYYNTHFLSFGENAVKIEAADGTVDNVSFTDCSAERQCWGNEFLLKFSGAGLASGNVKFLRFSTETTDRSPTLIEASSGSIDFECLSVQGTMVNNLSELQAEGYRVTGSVSFTACGATGITVSKKEPNTLSEAMTVSQSSLLRVPSVQPVGVLLLSADGRSVVAQSFSGSAGGSLDLRSIPTGVYIIRSNGQCSNGIVSETVLVP